MRLGKKQELFMRLLPRLIDQAHKLGFEIRGGDLFRDPRSHGKYGYGSRPTFPYDSFPYGRIKSNHKLKLAIDLNLMKNGKLITSTKGHQELGEWWEKQNDLCRWGGRIGAKNGKLGKDGNHYSLEHWGSY